MVGTGGRRVGLDGRAGADGSQDRQRGPRLVDTSQAVRTVGVPVPDGCLPLLAQRRGDIVEQAAEGQDLGDASRDVWVDDAPVWSFGPLELKNLLGCRLQTLVRIVVVVLAR